jgi:hypothetical protein
MMKAGSSTGFAQQGLAEAWKNHSAMNGHSDFMGYYTYISSTSGPDPSRKAPLAKPETPIKEQSPAPFSRFREPPVLAESVVPVRGAYLEVSPSVSRCWRLPLPCVCFSEAFGRDRSSKDREEEAGHPRNARKRAQDRAWP